MSVVPVDREALRTAAHRHHRPGVTAYQAIVLAFAELTGSLLDPLAFDDSAVLLRAERLILDGLPVSVALVTARAERATWSAPS